MFLQSRVVVHAMARVTEPVKMVCDYIQCIEQQKMSAQFRIIPLIDKIFKIRAQKIELQHSYIVHHFNLQIFRM